MTALGQLTEIPSISAITLDHCLALVFWIRKASQQKGEN